MNIISIISYSNEKIIISHKPPLVQLRILWVARVVKEGLRAGSNAPVRAVGKMGLQEAWGVRDLRLFLIGNAISVAGRSAFLTAAGWHVNELGGPVWFAWFGIAYFATHLPLLTVGGMLVDRIPRRTVALYVDFVQAGFALLFIIMLTADLPDLDVLIFAAAVMGASTAFSIPAIQALVPDLVDEETLASATGLQNSTRTISWSVGGLTGGAVITYSIIEVALFIDMITFLVSAYVLFNIEEVPIVRDEEGGSDFKAEMVHALAFTRSQPWLFVGILAFMAFHVGGAIVDIGIPTITLDNGWSGLYYGIWGATFPIGAAMGALYAGSNPFPKSSRGTVFYVTVSFAAWLDLLFAFVPWFVLILVITLVQGVMVGVLGVIWNTTIGDSVEQHLRGRVNSIDAIGSFILIPPSMLLGGKMIEELGIEAAFIVAVSIMVAATIIGIVVPSFRRFERIATERFPITADQSQSG